MQIIEHIADMQKISRQVKASGKKIALVPTMGALHEGHLCLVDEAKKYADVVIVSIFVNPTQFGPNEDYDRYPRDLQKDAACLKLREVDYLFAPSVKEVYPEGDQTFVEVGPLAKRLCGKSRPGHFRGVTTVVAKLFLMTLPDVAVFGEKDYQQLRVISQMVHDLHFLVQVVGVPTVREADGLAMSSRNAYLLPDERVEALLIYRAIGLAQDLFFKGEDQAAFLLAKVVDFLKAGKNTQIEYSQIVDAETLEDLEKVDRPARLVMAVRVGGKRLIDNAPLIPGDDACPKVVP